MATSRSDDPALERLLVVEHDHDAPAGLLEGWAAARGLRITTVRLHAGEPLPDGPGSCDAAVVLGSEQTAFDDTVPWLAGELRLVERLLAASVPVLGICFGGQVLARVLGARVYRLDQPEIGWAQARSGSPLLAGGPWLTWHRDGFELPAGAAGLAVNEVSLQAFSLGPHLGVQFHPEATRPIAEYWLAASDPPPPLEVTRPMFEHADGAWERAAANARVLFSGWLDGAFAGREAAVSASG
jgi:GMP synthase-like glutamine amidotransferase